MDGLARDGMAKVRRQVGQRREHEAARGHARMRDLEPGGIDHHVAIEQEVGVDGARTFGSGPDAA